MSKKNQIILAIALISIFIGMMFIIVIVGGKEVERRKKNIESETIQVVGFKYDSKQETCEVITEYGNKAYFHGYQVKIESTTEKTTIILVSKYNKQIIIELVEGE